jgi:hypothetical protein
MFAYDVPPGYLLVLRDVDAYGNNGGPSAQHLRVKGAVGQTIWLFQVDADTNAHGQWTGRQVFNPGTQFTLDTDAPFDVTASGYLLLL